MNGNRSVVGLVIRHPEEESPDIPGELLPEMWQIKPINIKNKRDAGLLMTWAETEYAARWEFAETARALYPGVQVKFKDGGTEHGHG